MFANYGYEDASGAFFITIDTDNCNGCGECVVVCPAKAFMVVDEDPNDPLRDEPVAMIDPEKRKSLKYECAPCKPVQNRAMPPCIRACNQKAITHSW